MNFLTADVVLNVNVRKLEAQLARAKAASIRTATKMEKAFKKMGQISGRIFSKMARGAKYMALAILGIGIASVKMAMDAEESENLFEVSMGKMAKAARAWSEEISDALYLNEFEIRKVIGTFNVMFESMGLGSEAAYDMAQGLTQLSYDMASFYNLKPAEAFQKLQAGITGETEPLKRLGILINETTVKQFALNNAMWDGVGAMTEQEKVQARYALILEQTIKAQGDMERTLNSSTNVFRSLWGSIKETAIGIGERLLKGVTKVGKAFRDWLGENQEKIIRKIGGGIDDATLYAESFVEQLRQANTEFTKLDTSSVDWVMSMSRGLRQVTKGVAYLNNGLGMIKVGLTVIAAGFIQLAAGATMAISMILKAMEDYQNAIAGTWFGRKMGVEILDIGAAKMRRTAFALQEEAENLWKSAKELAMAPLSTEKVDAFFDSVDARYKESKKRMAEEPDFITTFPPVIKAEEMTGGYELLALKEQELDAVKKLTKAENTRAEAALESYNQMRSALEFELEHLGDIDELRERALTYSQVELETNNMLNLSAEERNQKLTEYMELFDQLQEKQASFGHNIQLWMNQQADWGKKLAAIVTNAFDTMADNLAGALMGMEQDWKAFGRMFIKEILAMIIKMQLLFAWQVITGAGGGGTPSFLSGGKGSGPSMSGSAFSSAADGGEVTGTGWAKIHKGEVFSGVNNEMGFGAVTVNNYASDVVEVDVIDEGRVIEISRRTSIQAAALDGPYRQAHNIGGR